MTALTVQDGKLVLRDGKLATGLACCCGGGGDKCSGSCDNNGDCAVGCKCDSGQCVKNLCSKCEQGELPDTLTVTLDGFEDQGPGPPLIGLTCTSNYGAGASGVVTAPGGKHGVDEGPITEAKVTKVGSGYAKIGRVAPTLTISGGSGTGATFTPTLASQNDANGIPTWSLESVAASGGADYENGDQLTITSAQGDTQEIQATATLFLDRSKPDITLQGTATTSVAVDDNINGEWSVVSVAVTNGGSGYTEGDSLTFDRAADDVQVSAASAVARVVHDEPTGAVLTIYNYNGTALSSGTGAVLEPVWELLPQADWPAAHKKTYRLSSVNVVNGGSGYGQWEIIEISFPSPTDGEVIEHAWIDTDFPDANGTIQHVFVASQNDIFTETPAGAYVGSRTDALHSVQVTSGGGYYKEDPGNLHVHVNEPGRYYREDSSAQPYVADITVTIAQTKYQAGAGAQISATVNTDTSSPQFGQVIGFEIDQGGDGYLAWELMNTKCCGEFYNGMTVVVKRLLAGYEGAPCVYHQKLCSLSNAADWGRLSIIYYGPAIPPEVRLFDAEGLMCAKNFTTTEIVENCAEWNLTLTATGGATASVSSGGVFDPFFHNQDSFIPGESTGPSGPRCGGPCCKGLDDIPEEITLRITGGGIGGDYVLPLGWQMNGNGNIPVKLAWGNFFNNPFIVSVFIETCSLAYTQSGTPDGGGYAFLPDQFGCDFCHTKCRTSVVITGWQETRLCGNNDPNWCGVCEETPICSPVGKTFTLCRTDGQPGTATVEVLA